jgi:very-short-patch-repair endonuclease
MTKLYNRRKDTEKRRILRQNMTDAELFLWERLRKRALCGYRFRRQYSIKGFVIDFYSPELRLGIEVDGGYHLGMDQADYDRARQQLLESLEIKFLRFKNDEIFDDLDRVVAMIAAAINSSLSLPLNKGKMSAAGGQKG